MPYKILKGEMAKKDITIEEIAELLNIHRNSVSNKINKNASFTIEEAQKIWEKYFPEMELKYLFAKDEKEVG